ncbi:hypothetical protein BGZ92_006266, partial [Podila epicladia]
MGATGLWCLLRKKEHAPDVHDKPHCPSPTSKIRVDVAGSQFSTIRYAYSNTHSDPNNAHRLLEHCLKKLGEKDRLVLYVDGYPAAEKAKTHDQREKGRHKARDRAHKALVVLEDRLQTNKRIRKHHIKNAAKEIRSAFSWTMEDRQAFVDYMANKGFQIILCATEADIKIAADCEKEDVVVSGDSDLLIYKSVSMVCRPMGRHKSQWYWLYDKAAVLDALDVTSTQLVALAVISGNDYTGNIPTLGIETNRKLIKKLEDKDEASIIQNYLALPEVVFKTDKDNANVWTLSSFTNALKVFVTMKQDRAKMTTPLKTGSDATPTYDALVSYMNDLMTRYKQHQKEAYKACITK